ncbi:MAG: hypothetical protein M3512_18305 [Bacteroidota bacterium]|jgi:hypothetical protein|nr:hypothetical protein [Bacteroidota bacterium]
METIYTTKQLLLDITSMRSCAIELVNDGKKYNPLLKVLIEKDYIMMLMLIYQL